MAEKKGKHTVVAFHTDLENAREVEQSVTYNPEDEDIMTITHNGETLTMTKSNWNSLVKLSYQVLGNVIIK